MSDGHTARLESALAGRYRIRRKLGEGGMASVYLAEDIKHERNVALKILKPERHLIVTNWFTKLLAAVGEGG